MVNIPNYTGIIHITVKFCGIWNCRVPVTVIADQTVTINKALGSGSYTLKDVIKSTVNRQKESALLLDQKMQYQ
jgi:hypothetical protein